MRDFYPDAMRRDPTRVARFKALQLQTDPVSMALTNRMIATTDFASTLPAVRCQTMVLIANLSALASSIPHAQSAVVPTGHFEALPSQSSCCLNRAVPR